MLKAGTRQKYKNNKCKNLLNLLIGAGVYCSPHIQISMEEYSKQIEVKATKKEISFSNAMQSKPLKN